VEKMKMSQFATVEQYIETHPDADPKSLLDVLLQQNVRIREEYRASSEVEIDGAFNFRPKTMAQLQRLARLYAESGIVPDHFANNIAATAIAIQMALRCRVDILTMLQCSYPVHGKLGIESKLAIGMLVSSGQIEGRVKFRFAGEGKARACTAYVVDKHSGEELQQTVTWQMVEAEGWDRPKKTMVSKWITLPDLMFQYRSAIFLIRVFYPDVLLGMRSLDELEDMGELDLAGGVPESNGDAESIEALSSRLGAKKPAGRKKKPAETTTTAAAGSGDAGELGTDEPEKSASAPVPKPAESPPAAATETSQNQGSSPAVQGRRAAAKPAKTAPTGPQPIAGPAGSDPRGPGDAPAQPAKRGMTVAAAMGYMRARYEDEVGAFDLESIAKRAIGQATPTQYMDQIMTRRNPNWQNFLAKEGEDAGEEETLGFGDSEAAEDVNQDPGAVTQDVTAPPECVSNPMPRPGLSKVASSMEKRIIGLAQSSSIHKLLDEHVKGSAGLSADEAAYLIDLGERRAWQLFMGEEPTDRLPE
jgi:hypothetical protein